MEIRIKLEDDMFKSTEIAVLEKLRIAFEKYPHNYLPSLFTREFVGWATKRINDDFPLNVMEYINAYEDLDEVRRERDDLKATHYVDRDKLTARDLVIRDREKEIYSLRQNVDNLQTRMDTMVDCVTFGNMEREKKSVEDELYNLRKENKDLKAHLYDLMKSVA